MAWTLPDNCVLGIFGEMPEPGRVKARLAAEWGPDVAAEVHEAMLFDTLDVWDSPENLSPGGRRVLVYAPNDAGPWFDDRVPSSFAMQPQVDGDHGQRMEAFLAGELDDGADRVVLIGSDSPTLDPTIVVSAFLCLEGRDVVLGPATDGGFYLLGARRPAPSILEGIDWDRPDVLSQTIDRLADTDRSLALLPPWYTLGRPADLRMLAGHLRACAGRGSIPDCRGWNGGVEASLTELGRRRPAVLGLNPSVKRSSPDRLLTIAYRDYDGNTIRKSWESRSETAWSLTTTHRNGLEVTGLAHGDRRFHCLGIAPEGSNPTVSRAIRSRNPHLIIAEFQGLNSMRHIRRLTLLLAALPFFASACSNADRGPQVLQQPLDLPVGVQWKTQATYLFTIFSISPKLAWVVGSGGTIMRTDDGGKTWVQQASGTTADLLGMSFTDARHGWVSGLAGTILSTRDGGATWNKQSSGTSTPLYGIHFIDAVHGWAVGLQGTVVTTVDGGKTWVKLPVGGRTDGLLGIHFADAEHGWVVGEAGTILTTGDGGRIWSRQASGTMAYLYHVHFADPKHGWAVGEGGTIVSTIDGGKTWTKQNSDLTSRLIGVHFSDLRHGCAVGGDGVILETSDGGATWSHRVSGTISSISSVHFADAQHGWAAGDDGVIIQTVDGGKSWTAQSSGPEGTSLIRVHFADARHGWAVGAAGVILATTDGGKSWAKQSSGTSANLRGVHFVDLQHGWVVGDVGTVIATADGGKSWTPQSSGTQTFLNRVDFADLKHGWAVGSDGSILATADGGTSWTFQARGMPPFLFSVSFPDARHGWAVSAQGVILATADGGTSWNNQASFRSPPLLDVEFSDAQHGWVVGMGGLIVATSDGGKSWDAQNSGTQLAIGSVSFVRRATRLGRRHVWLDPGDRRWGHDLDSPEEWDQRGAERRQLR